MDPKIPLRRRSQELGSSKKTLCKLAIAFAINQKLHLLDSVRTYYLSTCFFTFSNANNTVRIQLFSFTSFISLEQATMEAPTDNCASWRDQAVAFNNKGVDLLRSGEAARAEQYFRAALKCFPLSASPSNAPFRTWSPSDPSPSSSPAQDLGSDASSSQRTASLASDQSVVMRLSQEPSQPPALGVNGRESGYTAPRFRQHSFSSHSCLLLYSQAISIPPERRFFDDQFEDLNVSTAILIFNLALVYHNQGIMIRAEGHVPASSPAEKLLGKAMLLYKKCYCLLYHGVWVLNGYQSTGSIAVDMLTMALLNNLIQITIECQNNDCDTNVDFYKNQLSHFYVSSATASYGNCEELALIEEQRSVFVFNLFLLNDPSTAGAA